jgi:hypothetical protein
MWISSALLEETSSLLPETQGKTLLSNGDMSGRQKTRRKALYMMHFSFKRKKKEE